MPDESVLGGTAGVPIQGDLVGANFVQRVKLDVGGDGVSTPVVGSLPVTDARLPAALGGTTAAASLPVVLSSDGPFATATGAITETAPTNDTNSSGLNGRLQRIAQRLTSLIALLPTGLGTGGGLKVDGSGTALPVSGTVAVSGTLPISTASDLPTTAKAATVPAPTTMQNAAVANGNGTSLPVTGYGVAVLNIVSSPAMSGGTTVNFEASVDDTTWVSIAAHSIGVNGALAPTTTIDGDYRIQVAGYKSVRARISTYSAGTVTVKGYTSPTPVSATALALASASTPTLANVAGSISSVTLLASNANRRGAALWNDSTSVCYVKFGATAAATSATVKLAADAYYEVPFGYTGIITGIWVTATGSMRTTEVTA